MYVCKGDFARDSISIFGPPPLAPLGPAVPTNNGTARADWIRARPQPPWAAFGPDLGRSEYDVKEATTKVNYGLNIS